MSNKVAVIVAHPDDELLGCGGTIAKHVEQGDEVYVLIVAESITSRNQTREAVDNSQELSELAQTALEANDIVGSTKVEFLAMPDNRMDSMELLDVVKQVEAFKHKYQPEIIYTHHASDVNIDHQYVHQAVITACRPQPGEIVKTILCFETASSTEWQPPTTKSGFLPNYYNTLTQSQIQKKLSALKVYEQEMRDFPHARSIKAIEALATWRGASVGYDYAEAFIIARQVND